MVGELKRLLTCTSLPRLLSRMAAALSYFSFRASPTLRKSASCSQHVLRLHEPDTPWHLQATSARLYTVCGDRGHSAGGRPHLGAQTLVTSSAWATSLSSSRGEPYPRSLHTLISPHPPSKVVTWAGLDEGPVTQRR